MKAARKIVRFERVASTMTEAATLANEGCASGTAVVADEQVAGIGRHGHDWHSEPGSGLYVSIVLRLELEPAVLPCLTLALGLAAAEAIARVADLRCDLRWPNDLMVGDRKLAGILVQLAGDAAICGVGINVNHAAFPAEIAGIATSLRIETQRAFDLDNLLTCLLESVDSFANMLVTGGAAAIVRAFSNASSYASGKRVRVDMGERTIEGVTAGLDQGGFLRVRKPGGETELILAGGVRPL